MNKNKNLFKRVLIVILIIFIILIIYKIDKGFYNTERNSLSNKYISFTFDDGYEDQYINAFPIFKKHEINATSYIITNLNNLEGYDLMTIDQLNDLSKNGWEIGSHSLTHPYLTRLSFDDIEVELKKSKQALLNKGFNIRSFSVPYGDYNKIIKDKSKLYYESTRTSIWGTNDLKNLDKYELKSKWIINSTSVSEMKSWVDQLSDGDWLIIMIHHVEEDKSKGLYSVSPQDLEEFVNYTSDKNIKIKTISGVLNEYK